MFIIVSQATIIVSRDWSLGVTSGVYSLQSMNLEVINEFWKYYRSSLQLIQHNIIFFHNLKKYINISFWKKVPIACVILLYIQLNLQAPPRERSTINKAARAIQEVQGSRHLVRIMRRIDEFLPPPRASSCGREVAIFSQLDAHPGVIYSNYKSARLPRWDACNACLAIRGRSNASIICDLRWPGSICTRESVRACHEPSCAYLSARVRSVWSLSRRSVLLIGLKGGFHSQ